MKTIEQVFLDTKAILEKQAAESVQLALDKIYYEYLPHVENDTISNVVFQSCDWIKRYLSDSLTEDDFKIDIKSVDVRNKIWNEHKEELKSLISDDVLARLKTLEERQSIGFEHRYL